MNPNGGVITGKWIAELARFYVRPQLRLVNTVSACRILRISRATLYRRMRARAVKYVVRNGRRMVQVWL